MLISSTKIAIFLPGGAPNRVLFFFSSFSSILYWVLAEVVWADMLMKIGCIVPLSFYYCNILAMIADLPTPELPVKKMGFSTENNVSRMNVCFVVS
jgi:hypothetical protein